MMIQDVKISLTNSGKKSWQPLTKHNLPSAVPIQNHINPVYAFPVYIFNMNKYFNTILQSTARSSMVSFLYVFPPKFYVNFFFRHMDQSSSLPFPLLTSFQITCPSTHKKAPAIFHNMMTFFRCGDITVCMSKLVRITNIDTWHTTKIRTANT
jgi:hypothetical protein